MGELPKQRGGESVESVSEQPRPTPEPPSEELRLLTPAELKLKRAGSRLQLQGPDDEEWRQVGFVPLFPLSDEESWISVLDKEGKEIGILKTLDDMPAEPLSLVREELRRRYVVPRIRRIHACRDRYDLLEWRVETNRGPGTFLTRDLREQVQQPLPNHFTITDVEGNRYDIPDLTALDPASRALLDAHL